MGSSTAKRRSRREGWGSRFTLTAVTWGLVLGAAQIAIGAEVETGTAGWTVAEAPHFTVYSNAGEEAARRAAADLESLRGFLVEIAPAGRFDAEIPFQIYLFGEADQLRPFLPGEELISAGFIISRDDGVYGATAWPKSGENPGRFLFRQYISWVVAENLPELPTWFRKGLADYYSTFEIIDSEAHLGRLTRHDVEWLRGGGLLIPEAEVVAESPEAGPDRRRAWAMIHRLVVGDDELRTKVPGYLRRLAAGDDPDVAFQAAFGMTVKALEDEVDVYVQGERFRYVRVPLAQIARPNIAVTPMPPADVDFRLGDLHLQANPPGDPEAIAAAQERFRRALTVDPEHPLAHAGTARIAAQRGNLQSATAGYQKAVEGRPQSYRLHYLLGTTRLTELGGRRPADEAGMAALDQAISSLRRAAELGPGFAAAWERLGYALTLSPEPGQEAVTALERAAELRPRRLDIVSNLLLARARMGDREGVAAAMDHLRQLRADEATLARGRDMELRLMLRYGESLARADRLDDAVAVLAQVRAEIADPAMREAAARQLELVAQVAQRNRYAELYAEAAEKIALGGDDATAAVAELQAMARPGLQREAAQDLASRLETPTRPKQETALEFPRGP